VRIEAAVTIYLRPYVDNQIAEHGVMPFGEAISITQDGLRSAHGDLNWADFGGYEIKNGALTLKTQSGDVWLSEPITEIDNIRLLLEMMREHMKGAEEPR
jgi:hypothetical protein